ncbi:DUF1919 domain-containing protein [bacterium]|jgi:uncharacterized protein (DUF1919 family)|nr:DUF1919 domain-containing protein [bacterium]|tara:strand:+ start:11314 stop:11850 length:537 start_codon:yes stop_codon:yes gene_type:complete
MNDCWNRVPLVEQTKSYVPSDNDTFLGNSCVSGWVYYYMKRKYNNPFIWHLILDDDDFIKVCKNFNYYMSQQPIFVDEDLKNGRYLNHHSISKTYPIMRLDDVNFHFIHHKDKKTVLDNFNKRVERLGDYNLIPVAWRKEIPSVNALEEFKNLPNSILAINVHTQEQAAKQIIETYGK